jgi:glycine/D-amino acid oxidase-like deaminating enzyme
MPASQIDFLIIGQGLAGSILAYELIARGQRIMVIDNDHLGSASKVAAGIINPITGHRLNLTEGFVDYYHRATNFYTDIEIEL